MVRNAKRIARRNAVGLEYYRRNCQKRPRRSGMFAYGLVGIFIGPVILAVFYELVLEWMRVQGEEALDPVEEAPAETENGTS